MALLLFSGGEDVIELRRYVVFSSSILPNVVHSIVFWPVTVFSTIIWWLHTHDIVKWCWTILSVASQDLHWSWCRWIRDGEITHGEMDWTLLRSFIFSPPIDSRPLGTKVAFRYLGAIYCSFLSLRCRTKLPFYQSKSQYSIICIFLVFSLIIMVVQIKIVYLQVKQFRIV